jgi:hypothetical protein
MSGSCARVSLLDVQAGRQILAGGSLLRSGQTQVGDTIFASVTTQALR